ncbi:MAG TPA: TMEM175 family protein [candidate division Zixibacteria bacterium]|jgi:uncharacterized membrane protein
MEKNETARIEAFSDGVLAIIITIMVLELRVPHSAELSALMPLLPVLLSYILSFVMLGTYWNNHHHLFRVAKRAHGGVMWANLHLLFWLSLFPFVTAWIGENRGGPWPAVLYGMVLLMAAIAYFILQQIILTHHGSQSPLAMAIGHDVKGKISIALYLTALPLAFAHEWISYAIYVSVVVMWLVPDRRTEAASSA